MSLDLDGWRARIDALNTKLVDLLNERARCALEIAAYKKQKSLPVHDPKREKAVLEKVAEHNAGPLTDEALQGIFRCIMAEHRKLEEEA
jgi:chorismate mutase/prephenate dehydratase